MFSSKRGQSRRRRGRARARCVSLLLVVFPVLTAQRLDAGPGGPDASAPDGAGEKVPAAGAKGWQGFIRYKEDEEEWVRRLPLLSRECGDQVAVVREAFVRGNDETITWELSVLADAYRARRSSGILNMPNCGEFLESETRRFAFALLKQEHRSNLCFLARYLLETNLALFPKSANRALVSHILGLVIAETTTSEHVSPEEARTGWQRAVDAFNEALRIAGNEEIFWHSQSEQIPLKEMASYGRAVSLSNIADPFDHLFEADHFDPARERAIAALRTHLNTYGDMHYRAQLATRMNLLQLSIGYSPGGLDALYRIVADEKNRESLRRVALKMILQGLADSRHLSERKTWHRRLSTASRQLGLDREPLVAECIGKLESRRAPVACGTWRDGWREWADSGEVERNPALQLP